MYFINSCFYSQFESYKTDAILSKKKWLLCLVEMNYNCLGTENILDNPLR